MTLVRDLAPISLEEIVADAAALTRIDRKYLVPVTILPTLLGDIADTARVLEISGQRCFGYSSTYFDTADLVSFRTAGQRRRRRFKVRTRCYLDSGDTFLEVKTRGARGTTVKERIPYRHTNLLDADGAAFVDERLAGAVIRPYAAELAPSLTTAYERITLSLGTDRATVDTGLSWIPTAGGAPLPTRGLAIVETKAGSSPTLLDRALWHRGHRPVRLSKYGTGIALIHPGAPRLKWHHVITRYLTPALVA